MLEYNVRGIKSSLFDIMERVVKWESYLCMYVELRSMIRMGFWNANVKEIDMSILSFFLNVKIFIGNVRFDRQQQHWATFNMYSKSLIEMWDGKCQHQENLDTRLYHSTSSSRLRRNLIDFLYFISSSVDLVRSTYVTSF
jgi:hypothetical protein